MNPYLILKVSSRESEVHKEYHLDKPSLIFFKHYDFEPVFSSCPIVEVRAKDHDMIFSDELIGVTFDDLEDKYLLPVWIAIKQTKDDAPR